MGIDEYSLADWFYRQQMGLQPNEKSLEIKDWKTKPTMLIFQLAGILAYNHRNTMRGV